MNRLLRWSRLMGRQRVSWLGPILACFKAFLKGGGWLASGFAKLERDAQLYK